MEIDGFDTIINTLMLAKDLHEVGRFEIVENDFFDDLCYDSYYENIMGVFANIFSGYYSVYSDDDGAELMIFEDDLISEYFVRASEYGRQHKIPHDKNPYVLRAQEEARGWLSTRSCMGYRLLAYTKSKRTAKRSKLLVMYDTSCCGPEAAAFGVIQLYKFFNEAINRVPTSTDTPIPGQMTLDDYGKELMAA